VTYTQQNLGAGRGGGEQNPLTARQVGVLDTALVDHEARIVALVAALAALDARVVVLEEA
jgi:hypothetical protein